MTRPSLITMVICLLLFAGTAYGQDPLDSKTHKAKGSERATWRFEIDNDVLFNKDNQITSGWSVQKHSTVTKSWEDLEGVPQFIGRWGAALPTLTKKGLRYRAGIAVGQIIQTPDDDSRRDLNKDDVPFAGALTAQTSWYAFNDDEFRGFEIVLGVVGPHSLAEQTQKKPIKFSATMNPEAGIIS